MQGIPLIMETPVQEREPPVNYKLSLEHGRVQWKDTNGPYGVGMRLQYDIPAALAWSITS